ncbi:MAG: ribosomal protein S18-alanine N-acetyltransferase [Lachnospiraceae bacterium]|nr:ribosomal protein S18-alanine N-acetyltransferase [Lachnospiraceae bacterium]
MKVRPIEPKDIPAVYNIEWECFSDSWSEKTLQSTMNEKGHSLFVAEEDGDVIGYGVTRQVLDECEILRIAVKKDSRKKGAGNLLMGFMVNSAVSNGAQLFFLEVREHNIPAIALYRKHGFIESGLRKEYYKDPVESAVLMSKCIPAC